MEAGQPLGLEPFYRSALTEKRPSSRFRPKWGSLVEKYGEPPANLTSTSAWLSTQWPMKSWPERDFHKFL